MFNSKSKIFCFFLVCFIIVTAFFEFFKDEVKDSFYNGKYETFQGIIIDEPDRRINQTKLTVKPEKKFEGKVLVSVSLYPEYQYGDLLEINCKLKKPEPFEDFRYDRYLAKDGVYLTCSYPKIKLISRGNGNWLLINIFKFKSKLQQTINNSLPEPQASLFSAITLGARRGVPQELSDKFSITGTSHLIAISGLHITIITVILIKLALACYLSRKKAFWLVTAVLAGYVTMIGFPPSAVRAALMGWLAMLAIYVGRLNHSINALLFVASLMILVNPKILRDDVGFQLSFCAVLGLIYFSPFFEKLLAKYPGYFGIKESLQISLSAQITTMPLIIYNFGRLSLIGPLANLLVLPILPYMMIWGFSAMFLELIAPGTHYFFWPVWLILTYLIKVVEFLALIPYAALSF
jgi:competence protein ComEC